MNWAGWLPAFLATLATETPVYVWALRGSLGVRYAAATALALNLTTHPLAWSAMTATRHPFPVVFLCVESCVWAIEAWLVWLASGTPRTRRRLRAVEALAVSLAANGLSAGIGLFL